MERIVASLLSRILALYVTDCPAYLILSFLFRPLVLLPSVTPGRFAPFAY